MKNDDTIPAGTVELAAVFFRDNPMTEMVCGPIRIEGSQHIDGSHTIGNPSMQRLNPNHIISGLTLTNACIFRRSVFERIGSFDLRFSISSDCDFLARCYLQNIRCETVDQVLYSYGAHDGSLTFNGTVRDPKLLDEYYFLARLRFDESSKRTHCLFFGRWLVWAAFMRCIGTPLVIKHWRDLAIALFEDRRHFFLLFDQLLWHIGHRKERHPKADS